jgi:hypothetical protein
VTVAAAGTFARHWKTLPPPFMIGLSVGHPLNTGAWVSFTVIVWLHCALRPQSSVAVHVRVTVCFTLLTQLPGVVTSEKVTVRFWSQLSVNTGVPNDGVAGHSMIALSGQLVTCGGCVSFTVTVWTQLDEFPQASVEVHVRVITLLQELPGLL